MEKEPGTPAESEQKQEPQPEVAAPVPWLDTPEGKEYTRRLTSQISGQDKRLAELTRRLEEKDLTAGELQSLRGELERQQDLLATLIDQQAGVTQPEPTQSVAERLRQQRQAGRLQVQKQQAPPEISDLMQKAGLHPDSLLLDAKFSALWGGGKRDKAIQRAKEFIRECGIELEEPVKPEDIEAKAERRAQELYKERLKKSGIEEAYTGTGAAGGKPASLVEASKLYAEGKLSEEDMREALHKFRR